jgi:hypothetical protein
MLSFWLGANLLFIILLWLYDIQLFFYVVKFYYIDVENFHEILKITMKVTSLLNYMSFSCYVNIFVISKLLQPVTNFHLYSTILYYMSRAGRGGG